MRCDEPECDASPLDAVLGFQLRRAHMLFAQHWQLQFRTNKPLRVTPMQGGMLISIADRPGITQAALARLMDVEGPTLLQALDKIEQAGLVQRTRRLDDRRSFALHLTSAGAEAVVVVRRFLPQREAELLVDLTAEERALLLDMLRRVVRRGRSAPAVSCGHGGADAPAEPGRRTKPLPFDAAPVHAGAGGQVQRPAMTASPNPGLRQPASKR